MRDRKSSRHADGVELLVGIRVIGASVTLLGWVKCKPG